MIAIAIGVLAVPSILSIQNPARALESPDTIRSISVTGVSTTKVMPDRIAISFAAETQEKTALEAAKANAEIVDRVIRSLEAAGVQETEIRTSYYSIYPVYEYRQEPISCHTTAEGSYCSTSLGSQVLVGYRAINSVVVESAILDKTGQWIDAAVEAGANRVDSIYFSLSPEKQDEIRNALIPMAVEDAKSKAQVALDPLNLSITNVLSVNLDSYPAVIYPKRGFDYEAGLPSSTPIVPGPQEVSTTVHVTFEIGVGSQLNSTDVMAMAGEDFSVTLDSNPSTGYHWEVSSITNSQLVRFANSEFVQADSDLLGAGGKEILTFQALKEGKTTIVLDYVRSWDKDNPADTYVIHVTVK
jgi:uncharacterized protein YggE